MVTRRRRSGVPQGADRRRRARRALRLLRAVHPLPTRAEAACALWTAHTHFVELFELVAYLAISSAIMRSGKTHLLTLIRPTSARGRNASGASESAIFRQLAESPPPTLCFDEVDNYIGAATERTALIGMLNEGFVVDGTVQRTGKRTGGKRVVENFSVYGAKSFTGVGTILPTQRSIAAFRFGSSADCAPSASPDGGCCVRSQAADVRDLLAGWAVTAADDVERHYESNLAFTPGTNERAEDLWEPLLAVAEAASVRAGSSTAGSTRLTSHDDDSGQIGIAPFVDA